MLFLNEDTKYIASNSAWGVVEQQVYDMDLLVESMGIPEGFYGQYFSDDPIIMGYEMLAEMNSGWDALEKDMLLCEAHAVIQGVPLNENAFTEKVSQWWKAIKNFFIKIWASIKDFFRKVWLSISTKFQKAEKWWKDNQSQITETSVEIEAYPNLLNGKYLIEAPNTVFKHLHKASEESKEGWEKAVADLENDPDLQKDGLRAMIFGGKQAVKFVATKEMCGKTIMGQADVSKTLTSFQNEQAASCKEAIAAAEKGEQAAKDGGDAKKQEAEMLAAKIKYLKKKQAIIQEVCNLISSASNSAVTLAYSVAKKLYLMSKRSKRPGEGRYSNENNRAMRDMNESYNFSR